MPLIVRQLLSFMVNLLDSNKIIFEGNNNWRNFGNFFLRPSSGR
jgi:hypothetical protein